MNKSNKSIHSALYVDKVILEGTILGMHYDFDFITDEFSSMDQWADRSDLAVLNDEWQSGKLQIIKELVRDDRPYRPYTHIVLDSDGTYFAVVIADGDWI